MKCCKKPNIKNTMANCDCCTRRGEKICPLHMDLKLADLKVVPVFKHMRREIYSKTNIVMSLDGDIYKAVLKNGAWVFSYMMTNCKRVKLNMEPCDIATDMDVLIKPTKESISKEILKLVKEILIKWETYNALVISEKTVTRRHSTTNRY